MPSAPTHMIAEVIDGELRKYALVSLAARAEELATQDAQSVGDGPPGIEGEQGIALALEARPLHRLRDQHYWPNLP